MSDQNQSYNDGIEAAVAAIATIAEHGVNHPGEALGLIASICAATRPAPDEENENLVKRLLTPCAVVFGHDTYCNCEDDEVGAEIPIPVKLRDDLIASLRRALAKDEAAIRADEREQCARYIEGFKLTASAGTTQATFNLIYDQLAAAIRARGRK